MLDACAEHGWLDRHVFFVPWVPYDSRTSLYLEPDVATVLHRPRFETEISMRTRVLEHLWAGLPTIATAGGGMSRLLAEHDMGLVVPDGDREALIDALTRLLGSEELRRELAERGRRWAAEHTWDKVLEPLADFLAAPRVDPHKHRYPVPAPHTVPEPGLLERIQRRLRRR